MVLFLMLVFTNCKNQLPIEITAEDYHLAQDQLTSVMVHDIFSPPLASRVYAYANIAAHEILAQDDGNDHASMASVLSEFNGVSPIKDSLVNPRLAGLMAFMEVGKNLIFSVDRISEYMDDLSSKWKAQNPEVYEASNRYAHQVSGEIKAWYDQDNYKQTRTYPKFSFDYDSPSRWQPTPPDYMDGIEPHWSKIRPFVLNSVSQFQPEPPPPFSMVPESDFYQELIEVYELSLIHISEPTRRS